MADNLKYTLKDAALLIRDQELLELVRARVAAITNNAKKEIAEIVDDLEQVTERSVTYRPDWDFGYGPVCPPMPPFELRYTFNHRDPND